MPNSTHPHQLVEIAPEGRERRKKRELEYGRKNVKLLLALLLCYLWVGFGGKQEIKTAFQIQKWTIANKLQRSNTYGGLLIFFLDIF